MGFQIGDLRALVTPLVTEFGRNNQPIKPWAMTPTKQSSPHQLAFFVMTTAVTASAADARQAAQK